jgi:Luciferase-like monooxygenase
VRVSVQIRPNPEDGRLLPGMADYARRAEAAGFPGIWVGDSMGRGRPTLDPLATLAAIATATEKVELGIAVLQVSLRHPIELAERPESAELSKVAHTSLICPPDEARQRIKRIEQMGFDELLLVSQLGVLEDIERARDFL